MILLINLLRGGIPGVSMELLQMNRLSTRPIAKASHGTITLGVFNALSRGMVFLGVNLVAICVLSSCSVARTVHSQSDFDALPPNTGDYGGSFPVQTWSYMGSDERYDHFIYTPTRDNMPKPTRVRVVRGLVALDFEPQLYPLPIDGFPLVPQFSEGRIIGFSAETNATRFLRDVLESNDTFKSEGLH